MHVINQPIMIVPLSGNITLTFQVHTMDNSRERWCRKFASAISCHHPARWKFMDGILAQQVSIQRTMDRNVGGHGSLTVGHFT